MQSILVVSQNRKSAKEYINKLLSNEKVDTIDININSFEKTVGIEDVRNIQKKIFLKPLRSKTKAVVIESYEGITIESQNALLKILEEPPNNTTIIIVSDKIGQILPTILSRCKVVELKEDLKISKEESAQYLNILVSISSSGVGERLKLAQDAAKNKDGVIPELEKMIIIARKRLIDSVCHSDQAKPEKKFTGYYARSDLARDDNESMLQCLNILILLNKTYDVLKTTNVNTRFALENLFLNI